MKHHERQNNQAEHRATELDGGNRYTGRQTIVEPQNSTARLSASLNPNSAGPQ